MKVELDRTRVDLAPGAAVTVAVTVHNDGPTAVTPDLRVTGIDGAGVSGAAVLPPVPPGGSWTTQLSLRLPTTAAAATRRVAVVAHDRAGRAEPAAAHLEVVTGSAAEVAVRLSPRDLRGRMGGRFRVHLDNQGDTTVELDLVGEAEGLGIRLKPAHVTLPPGGFVRVRGRVRSRRVALARSRRRAFLVRAQGTTTPAEAAGSFHQHTMLDGVLLKAVGVLVVLGLWAGGALAAVRTLSGSASRADAPATSTTTTVPAPSEEAGGAGGGDGGAGGATGAGGAGAGGADGAGSADGGAAAAPGSVAPAPAPGADGGGTASARAVVSGSVSGPAQLGGIAITVTRVALGDLAGQGGKLLAAAVAPRADAVAEQRTTTDEGGRFRFASGLEVPALYRVTALKPGFEQASVLAELTTNAPSVDLAISLVAATGRLAGVVTGPDGAPVGDATITVSSASLTYTTSVASDGDARGTWSIDGIATPASYVVAAVSPGYATASTVVNLAGGEARAGVDLALVAGAGTIRGVVSSRGTGVGGVTVTAQQVGGDVRRSTTTLTQADLRGRFDLPGLPLGRYTLTVEGSGWLTETSQVVLDQGDLVVTLSDLRLSTATIQGRVLQEALITPACGYPDADYDPVTVTPQPCGNVGVTVANLGGTWRTTTAGTDGGFVVSGIPAGTYTVTFERYGYVSASLTVTVAAGDVTDVGPTGATGVEPVVLELVTAAGEGLAVVQGVVRDETDPGTALLARCLLTRVTITDGSGGPVLDAAILPDQCPEETLSSPSVPPTSPILPCATVASGVGVRACWLTGGGIRLLGLVAGAKQLRVSALGFDETVLTLQVPLGGTVELGVILLEPLATLTGMVLGPNDTPLADARIMVAPVDAATVIPDVPPVPEGGWQRCEYLRPAYGSEPAELLEGLCVTTGPSGDYEFGRALRSGRYELIAPVGTPTGWSTPAEVPLDHELRVRIVEARAGSVVNQDINLRRYGTVYGVVQTPQASGGFGFVDTPVISVRGTVDGLLYCQAPQLAAIDGPAPCRISRPDTGGYRIDRLRELAGGYAVTFTKTDGAVVYQDRVEQIAGGVTFNTELLRNQILTVPAWGVSGSVGWRAGPGTVIPLGDVEVAVTGVTAYQVLALPPFREATVVTSRATTGTGAALGTFTGAATFVSPEATVEIATAGFAPYEATVARTGPTTNLPAVELEPLTQTLNGALTMTPARRTSGSPLDIVDDATVFGRLTATATSRLTGQQTITTVTGTGTFAMPGLRPGHYVVTVAGPGIEPLTIDGDAGVAGEQDVLLDVGAGAAVEATGAVVRRGRLRVKLTEAGSVPVKGATVVLKRAGTTILTGTTCVDPTELGGIAGCEAGTVTFDDLTDDGAGSWAFTVSATKLGWAPVADAAVDLATARSQELAVSGIVRFGWITGTVRGRTQATDTNAVALAGAAVTAGGITTYTAADGSFTLAGTLVAGATTVTVTSPGYVDGTQSVTVVNGGGVSAGTIVLTARTASLSGKVVDGPGGVGFPDVTVKVLGTSNETTTDSAGLYSLDLPPGLHSIEFSADDGRPAVTRTISLAPGSAVTGFDITMSGATSTAFGVVSGADATGATTPLEGASLTWTTAGGTPTAPLVTGSSGSFTFPNVPADEDITISVTRSGYDPVTVVVNVAANQSEFLPITMQPQGRTVTVTVRDAPTDVVLAGVTVIATSGSTVTSGTTAADGTVGLSLKTGTWTFTTSGASTSTIAHYDATSTGSGSVSASVPKHGTGSLPSPIVELKPWETVQVVLQGRQNALEASPTTAALVPTTHAATVDATVNGVPVSLAHVDASPGTYRARGAWGPVTYSLALAATGYESRTVSGLTLTANAVATTTQTVTATARTVTVTVSSAEGGTLGGVSVDAAVVVGTTYATGITASDGTVTLTLPPSANWRLATRNAATATATGAGTVPHANTTNQALTVPVAPAAVPAAALTLTAAAASVTGAVSSGFTSALMTGTTQAQTGATVTATLGAWSKTTGVLTASTYSLGVWQGTWTVAGTLANHTAPSTQTLSVPSGGAVANLAFTRRAATMAGTVTDGSGTGVADVTVTLRRDNNATVLETTTTDAQGNYAIAGLDPIETYDVTFDPSGLSGGLMRQPVTYTVAAVAVGSDFDRDHQLSAQAGVLTVNVVGALQGQTSVAHPMATAPTVTFTRPADGTAEALQLTVTMTAATGGWTGSVTGLSPASNYSISVTPPSGWGTTTGAAGPVTQTALTVTGSATTTTTVTLSPLPQALTVSIDLADGTDYVGPITPRPVLRGGGIGSGGQTGTSIGNGQFTFTNVPVSTGTGAAAYTVDLPTVTGFVGGTLPGFTLAVGDITKSFMLQRLTATVAAQADVNTAAAAVTNATVSVSVDGVATPYAFVAPTSPSTTYRIDGVLANRDPIVQASRTGSDTATQTPDETFTGGTVTTLAVPLTLALTRQAYTVTVTSSGGAAFTNGLVVATPSPLIAGASARQLAFAGSTAQAVPLLLEPGTWSLVTTADDHEAKTTAVTVPAAGGTAAVTLSYFRPVTLTIASSTSGFTLTGLDVAWSATPSTSIGTTSPVSLALKAGTGYSVVVRADGHAPTTHTFTVTEGSTTQNVAITLNRYESVTVVVEIAGSPVDDAVGTLKNGPTTINFVHDGVVGSGRYIATGALSGTTPDLDFASADATVDYSDNNLPSIGVDEQRTLATITLT